MIEKRANELLEIIYWGLNVFLMMMHWRVVISTSKIRIMPYVKALGDVVDMKAIKSGFEIGIVDPLGGSGVNTGNA